MKDNVDTMETLSITSTKVRKRRAWIRSGARASSRLLLPLLNLGAGWKPALPVLIGWPEYLRGLFAIALSLLVSVLLTLASSTAISAESVKLFGSLNELATYSQAAGIALSSTKLPASVRSVRLGSPAIYSGVAKGDRITAAAIDKGSLNLTFQRDGHTYQARVPVSASALRAIQAQLDQVSKGPTATGELAAQTSNTAVDALKDYDVVFLVDRSGSMAESSTHGHSKWQWCEDHIAGFARDAERVLPDGVRMITFNTYADDHGILNASQVEDVFLNTHPAGGTDAAAAIDRAVSRFKERPMLLCIMTDGQTDERRLQAALSKAALLNGQNKMVSVAFFQIGEDPEVERFLSNLPLAISAKPSTLITYKNFGEIVSTGLSKCLLDTILQMKNANTSTSKSTK